MLSVKTWREFDQADLEEGRLLVYGAGVIGRRLINLLVDRIEAFCDRDAERMPGLVSGTGKVYPVITPDRLRAYDGKLHVIVSIITEVRGNSAALDEIRSYFADSTADVVLYVTSADGVLTFDGREYIYEDHRYVMNNLDRLVPMYPDWGERAKRYVGEMLRAQLRDCRLVSLDSAHLGLLEMRSRFVNHRLGKRVTVGQPEEYDQTLHIFGDSRSYGWVIEDRATCSSLVQRDIRSRYPSVRVVNHGIIGIDILPIVHQLRSSSLRRGDVVFLLSSCLQFGSTTEDVERQLFVESVTEAGRYCRQQGCRFVFVYLPAIFELFCGTPYSRHLRERFIPPNTPDRAGILYRLQEAGIVCCDASIELQDALMQEDIFLDSYHYTPYGNQVLAGLLSRILDTINQGESGAQPLLRYQQHMDAYIDKVRRLYEEDGCHAYTSRLKAKYRREGCSQAGAIVVNCNPFTRGHLGLIEYAAAGVEVLYVFVLQEDKSFFPYQERFYLVQENTRHIENVVVVPGGDYVISSLTFPEYFEKETASDREVDSSADLLVFASRIAPALGITKRFVGEEPYCRITGQYNAQMKDILPEYGIEVIEIPRFKAGDEFISASYVRRLLKEKQYSRLEALVPPATYALLLSKYCEG